MTEITVTLKGGPGYDAPWIVVKGDTPSDISNILGELSSRGAFEAVQTLAAAFRNAPIVTSDDAVRNVKDAFPNAEVVREEDARPTAAAASPAPGVSSGQAPAASVAQSTPPCETCGGPTTFRQGNHPTNGAWEAYFCDSGDRAHTRFLGR